uniref:Putative secreted protein n=1 Tax=Anopheles marajoara TaxID=58244 RepID=A0A2M4CG05_9DIPT
MALMVVVMLVLCCCCGEGAAHPGKTPVAIVKPKRTHLSKSASEQSEERRARKEEGTITGYTSDKCK